MSKWTFKVYMGDDAMLQKMVDAGMKPIRNVTNSGDAPIVDEEGQIVALAALRVKAKRGHAHEVDDHERDANAALIAAAPELLDALKQIVAQQPYMATRVPEICNLARAAIAKAERGRK